MKSKFLILFIFFSSFCFPQRINKEDFKNLFGFVNEVTIKENLLQKDSAGRFLNNIVFTTRTDSISTDATIDSGYAALMYDTTIDSSNYNLIYPADLLYNDVRKTYAEWQGLGLETNSITSNPLLDAEYKLTDGSPAIGTGTNGQNIGATR